MNLRTALSTLAVATVIASPALADMKIVQVTTIKNPAQEQMLKRLSPEQRAEAAKHGMGAPIHSVTYVSGPHTRVDTTGMTTLSDTSTKTIYMLNNQTHQYSKTNLNTAAAGAGSVNAKVQKTTKTKMILGHLATLYHLNMVAGQAGTMAADVWAAGDIPQPPAPPIGGPAAAVAAAMRKINGMPLLVVMHAQSPYGEFTITSSVKSISNGAIPASTFKIPASFKPAPAGAGVGGGMFSGH